MLEALGLASHEEAVYRALLSRPAATAQDLAGQTGIDRAAAERIVRDLVGRGLVAVATEAAAPGAGGGPEAGPAPARYRLTPPSVALAPVLVRQRNALSQAETAYAQVAEQYRGTAMHTAAGLVEVVVGVEQVAHRFHQLQHGAQRELLVFLVGAPVAVPREETDGSEGSALRRGVDFRVVAAREYLGSHDMVREVREAVRAGLDLRMAESLPLKMVVSDRERAMVPLDTTDSGGEPSAIVLHRSGLLTALVHLFEREWAIARPMFTAGGEVREEPEDGLRPTAEELEVLALLLAGVSDRRAAAQLGLSIRTVERRVRRLTELAGGASRLQLGYHAARAGWL
ncbi:Sugar-specific transcriptional regulator TrmB [Actinacidiphila rubida]|uniref:Sugar-specific transcriptional regulator TrmB n=1 Tax=Actinacidiphila rubida TaxID=310780 RepID=A0A1H8M7I6_9ACTN|nr:helix-turn-helix domain-containing protein [Actinacidiphila rubida]SEO13347.1 Sugar-specific transcriptional regulator TrmB [Actinacidiphila rubida]